MLNHVGKYFVACLLFFSCDSSTNQENGNSYKKVSEKIIGAESYKKIYGLVIDSLQHWCLNKVSFYKYSGVSINFMMDSLICFNTNANRFVGCILKQQLSEKGTMDDIDFFYGEKIDGNWFFVCGENQPVMRTVYKNHPVNQPLSYQQLHQAALRTIYSGYLSSDGTINDAWVLKHFENSGWGLMNMQDIADGCLHGKRYTDQTEFYKAMFLCGVKANWASRDTTKPIVPLPAKNLP